LGGFWVESKVVAGARCRLARMSFGRRLSLMHAVRDAMAYREFKAAGDSVEDRLDASILALQLDRVYWHWGVLSVEGPPEANWPTDPARMWELAPEAFTREMLDIIKQTVGLSESDRKN
jgi:hypothetical protein